MRSTMPVMRRPSQRNWMYFRMWALLTMRGRNAATH